MALGSFLAGVLLAESEYRHEIEAAVEPFKGLLLGLFFVAVGMSVDFGLLLGKPLLILGIIVGLFALKSAVLWVIARAAKLGPDRTAGVADGMVSASTSVISFSEPRSIPLAHRTMGRPGRA